MQWPEKDVPIHLASPAHGYGGLVVYRDPPDQIDRAQPPLEWCMKSVFKSPRHQEGWYCMNQTGKATERSRDMGVQLKDQDKVVERDACWLSTLVTGRTDTSKLSGVGPNRKEE